MEMKTDAKIQTGCIHCKVTREQIPCALCVCLRACGCTRVELTVCFFGFENFADTSEREQDRYYNHKVHVQLQANGWRCHLWPVQVEARGIVDETSFNPLHALCKTSVRAIANL